MNYATAVAIRERQLSGEAISPTTILLATQRIRAGAPQPQRTLPEQLLAHLQDGPMERAEFWRLATDLYSRAGRQRGPWQRLAQLQHTGLLIVEARLTDDGREWLEGRT